MLRLAAELLRAAADDDAGPAAELVRIARRLEELCRDDRAILDARSSRS